MHGFGVGDAFFAFAGWCVGWRWGGGAAVMALGLVLAWLG